MPSHDPHPTPTLPPKKPKRKSYTGLIWPKEPPLKPKSQSTSKPPKPSRRWLDLLTGKGPDIFLGNISHPSSPTRSTWSQWSHVSGIRPVKTVSFLPWPFPLHRYDRRPTQVYDFAARRYKEWTPDWHPANYPCAYCCCMPWRDCRHLNVRRTAAALSPYQRGGMRWDDCCDPRVLEANEHECGCEVCWMHVREQQQQQQDRVNIANYRCDELS